jgi:hypothetical protein
VGSTGTIGNCVAIDSNKNVYTFGYFGGTTDFDPGTGTTSFNTFGSNDIFLSKLDASGNFVWAKHFGGTGFDLSSGICTDTSGNVYLTGFFEGTVDFDPSANIFNLTANVNATDSFIVKLDANGNFIWAKSIGGSGETKTESLGIDASGYLLITGYFDGTTDFNPSTSITKNITTKGSRDIFISKLDNSGNLVWVKTIGSTSSDYGTSSVQDATGNIYITGDFLETVDFDPNVGIANLVATSQSSFVLKLDGSGEYLWAKKIGGGINNPYIYQGKRIALDSSNNIYTTGIFSGLTDFDPNNDTAYLNSDININGQDAFICKLDNNGNYLWAKSLSGNGEEIPTSISVDAMDNVYTIGHFTKTVNFNAGTNNITSIAVLDLFIHKLNADGNYIYTKVIQGPYGDTSYSAIIDKSDDTIYMTGSWGGKTDFNPDAGTSYLNGEVYSSAYIFKYGSTTLGLENYNLNNKPLFRLYPNPSNGQFRVVLNEFEEDTTIKICNILGQNLHHKKIDTQNLTLDFNLNKGVYFVSLVKGNGIRYTQKVVIE